MSSYKVFVVVRNTSYEGDTVQAVWRAYSDAERQRMELNEGFLRDFGTLDMYEAYVLEEELR